MPTKEANRTYNEDPSGGDQSQRGGRKERKRREGEETQIERKIGGGRDSERRSKKRPQQGPFKVSPTQKASSCMESELYLHPPASQNPSPESGI